MVELTASRLLQFARRLQHAATFTDLLRCAGDEAKEAIGFEHVWFMVADDEDARELRLIQVAGDRSESGCGTWRQR
ncbi:MAG: hypothetical protein QM756_04115 [Polyangiaceae bacterium]